MNINKTNYPWTIAGIGAIGGLLASCFCQRNQPVQLLLKNTSQLMQYQTKKLCMINAGNVTHYSPPAISMDQLDNQPIDYLISCVKAYDTTHLLWQLRNHLHTNSLIILIHNGLGVLEEIKEKLPQLRIISAVCTLGAYLESPFRLQTSFSGDLYLGQSIGQFFEDELKKVTDTFSNTTLAYQWCDNIECKTHEKFAINCAINILTALFSCKNGELLTHITLLEKLTNEIVDVIATDNIILCKQALLEKIMLVLQNTANNYSSMYMDIARHQPTEINYLNEYLLKLAQQKNIDTPINQSLVNQFYRKFPEQNQNKFILSAI